ncbi:MAG TPA: GIY-YIG nuclease family protein [Cyclobacteriaceae bacterium]|jgi:putative endonuclease|nr:GIY-YIG nuclease family protein [Cyclobacteriaceae bacterium]
MFTVYVLYSASFNKIYIGYTSNLDERMLSHNSLGKKGYTLKFRPWSLMYREEFAAKADAIRREKELKSAKGRRFIWELIEKSK